MPETIPPSATESLPKSIVFFDGECGLCNRFIRLLLKVDTKGVFDVAPLQGKTAKEKLPVNICGDLTTIAVLTKEHLVMVRSDAVIYIGKSCGWPWSLIGCANFIPKLIRDGLYTLVANNRHLLSKRGSYCDLPDLKFKERILE